MADATAVRLDRKAQLATKLAALSGFGAAIMLVAAQANLEQGLSAISMLLCAVLACLAVCAMILAAIRDRRRKAYHRCATALNALQFEKNPTTLRKGWHNLCLNVRDPLQKQLIRLRKPIVEQQLEVAENAVAKTRRQVILGERLKTMRDHATARIAQARASHPKLAARDAAVRNLEHVKARRIQLELDVNETLEGASWWQKLNYDYPDYVKMDREIETLDCSVKRFLAANGEDICAAEAKFDAAEVRAHGRMTIGEANAMSAIPALRHMPCDEDAIARNALLLSALTVPVSVWNDMLQANGVYDALRSVNGTYAEMNDFDIWLQCLTMPSESLVGLMSLTKGALFEAHVADSTGGILHEHFNTPDTDIVIDGTAYQIKATSSAAYIESVDPAIPVIATSEVAETTGAIDGGMSIVEIDSAVSLALGGTVIDGVDTVFDAAFTGFGGLGILATYRGIHHAIDRHREGIDKEEAFAEGVGVAAVGSIKATVDLAEMGYKVVNSRPSRFAGRQGWEVVKWGFRSLFGGEKTNHLDDTSRPQS